MAKPVEQHSKRRRGPDKKKRIPPQPPPPGPGRPSGTSECFTREEQHMLRTLRRDVPKDASEETREYVQAARRVQVDVMLGKAHPRMAGKQLAAANRIIDEELGPPTQRIVGEGNVTIRFVDPFAVKAEDEGDA